MTDRELLELAAKAAGMELDYTIRPDKKAFYHSERNALALVDGGWFAPLTDDGDALRLAVWLRLEIEFGSNFVNVGTSGKSDSNKEWHLAREEFGDGPLAATRLAIVRAAAEIGRQMP